MSERFGRGIEIVDGIGRDLKRQLAARDIADILWLAVQMRQQEIAAATAAETTPDRPGRPLSEVAEPASEPETATEATQENTPTEPAGAPLYEKSPQVEKAAETSKAGTSIQVPAPPGLKQTLALGRALRPLKRKVDSRDRSLLDEVATAERIAESQGKVRSPVLSAAPERWLDLVLVVEGETVAAEIWEQAIAEWRDFLERHGAFRNVRTFRAIERHGALQLRCGQQLYSPKHLVEPGGRRAIWVLSDCVSGLWQRNVFWRALQRWCRYNPTAIVQLLPRKLWNRSTLGFQVPVRLRSRAPGLPNRQLVAEDLPSWEEIDPNVGFLKLPVVAIAPEPMANLAGAIAGGGEVAGYLLEKLEEPAVAAAEETPERTPEEVAEERVRGFRRSSSPISRELAGLLAASPTFPSLPVARLIQRAMLPRSTPIHLAEVFLGGLLRRSSEATETAEKRGYRSYEFLPGVRKALLPAVPRSDIKRIFPTVSKLIEKQFGVSLQAFEAILIDPTKIDDPNEMGRMDLSDLKLEPFAVLSVPILRRLGGKYEEMAERVEKRLGLGDPAESPRLSSFRKKQLRDAILSAFPSEGELEIFVADALGESLRAIAGGNNLSQVAFRLIQWAEVKGKLETLVEQMAKHLGLGDRPEQQAITGMIELRPGDRKELLSFLEKLPEMVEERSRQQLLKDAGLGTIADRIDLSGTPAIAARAIVDGLSFHGQITPGSSSALGLFLLAVRELVGIDWQSFLDRLLANYSMIVEYWNPDTQEKFERKIDLVKKLEIELEIGKEAAFWLDRNRVQLAKSAGEYALNQYPKVKGNASLEEVNDFYFSIQQFLEQVSHCLSWGRPDILDSPEIPLVFNFRVYEIAFNHITEMLPSSLSKEIIEQIEDYLAYIIRRLPYY